jgi:hypothetical protein
LSNYRIIIAHSERKLRKCAGYLNLDKRLHGGPAFAAVRIFQ